MFLSFLVAAQEKTVELKACSCGRAEVLMNSHSCSFETGRRVLRRRDHNFNACETSHMMRRMCIGRGDDAVDEARKSFDIAIRLAPDRAACWIKLGNLLRIQHRYDEVLLTYEHAFTLDPSNAEAAALSSGVLLELGRYQEALAKCDLSLAISPDQAEALWIKGDCLHSLGRTAEAAASYS
jgi:tetratricopeptide (TPR) repeat protein